jgi:hypothetical protein
VVKKKPLFFEQTPYFLGGYTKKNDFLRPFYAKNGGRFQKKSFFNLLYPLFQPLKRKHAHPD